MDLVGRNPDKRFLELGRSCVACANTRTRRTLEALWQGNWAYALGSPDIRRECFRMRLRFQGDRPYAHALALSFLNQTAARQCRLERPRPSCRAAGCRMDMSAGRGD